MLTILDACHRIVMTEEIRDEWDRHASNWSRDWYAQMVRRSKARWVQPVDVTEIETGIDDSNLDSHAKAALRKDLRLVAAALAASRQVVTIDAECVQLFTHRAENEPALQVIRWIDPESGELPPHRH